MDGLASLAPHSVIGHTLTSPSRLGTVITKEKPVPCQGQCLNPLSLLGPGDPVAAKPCNGLSRVLYWGRSQAYGLLVVPGGQPTGEVSLEGMPS